MPWGTVIEEVGSTTYAMPTVGPAGAMRVHAGRDQARPAYPTTSWTTLPYTSVRRKSRPE
jgi:hypothetical protein